MSHFCMSRILLATLSVSALFTFAFANAADQLPLPGHVAKSGTKSQLASGILAARRYAAFWNTGDESLARAALSKNFTDPTLPAGRVQGIEGPLQASRDFRGAVPDLSAEIIQMVVAADRVSMQYRFRGHFTGRFGEVAGQGQVIDFIAFDLYRIEKGQIAENWHLEDNLGLLKQIGIVK